MNLTEKFLEFTTAGADWVLWLLIVLSVFSVYVMIERWTFLRSVAHSDAGLERPLLDAVRRGDFAGARETVTGKAGAGARIVSEMLGCTTRTAAALSAIIAAQRPRERLRLEGNVGYLGTLGANAPFIGLFGTVLGIIKAFKDLAEAGVKAGGDNTDAVMAGISEALVATAVGLLVAIPAVVAYNHFQRRAKAILSEADSVANVVFAQIANEERAAG